MALQQDDWILPDWPARPAVRALSTTRRGGVSASPYASWNLAEHVGDDPRAVQTNRQRLRERLALPDEPCWLRQVHGVRVMAAAAGKPSTEADGAWTGTPGRVCAVLTADCLPVLFCDRRGTRVAAAHAGWRGLAAGVLEATLRAMGVAPQELLAWLGPAIGPAAFEVGAEVRDAFVGADAGAGEAFQAGPDGRWYADLYALARRRLAAAGVVEVYGGGLCTYSDPERFYSYRRDGATGRMASLIWLESAA
ncbi:MAG TPA: peptidoglycan editing factor PgeF [Gammaproteobacteria bacterium]|nr:peptidoglycan editing factor PgeF [Gammaproteobacteria bacterium]